MLYEKNYYAMMSSLLDETESTGKGINCTEVSSDSSILSEEQLEAITSTDKNEVTPSEHYDSSNDVTRNKIKTDCPIPDNLHIILKKSHNR